MPDTAQSEDRVLVLVLEPDPYTQALQAALLGTQYSARFVPDGEQALALARRLRPAVVIADILVPKVDGLRVCKLLKEDPDTRNIRVMIFTELLAERRARDAGADVFLRKPLEQQRFLQEVQRLLREASALDEGEVSHGEHGTSH